jgi:hypothetical protein
MKSQGQPVHFSYDELRVNKTVSQHILLNKSIRK